MIRRGLTVLTVLLFIYVSDGNAASIVWCDEPRGHEAEEGSATLIPYSRSRAGSTLNWTLVKLDGQDVHLAYCAPKCEVLVPGVEIDDYRIWFHNAARNRTGTLLLKEIYGGSETVTTCQFNTYAVPRVNNCTSAIHPSNWTVSGSCEITRAFSTRNVYEYSAADIWEFQGPGLMAYSVRFEFKRFFPEPYTNESDGKTYYKQTLEYSFSLPNYDGKHSLLTLVYPGLEIQNYLLDYWKPRKDFSMTTFGNFRIENPQLPTHNCENLMYIPEEGDVPCVCSTSSLGTPEGRLIWLAGDQPLAVGEFGAKHLHFPSYKVNRAQDGVEKKCQLDWVVKKNVSVTNSVAYGPDSVVLNYWQMAGSNDTTFYVIRCLMQKVNPMTAQMIHWGGLCQGQTGFTCIVNKFDHSGNEVTCTAVNTANNGRSARASINVDADGVESASHKNASPGLMKGVAIGCGAALGVLTAIVVVVVTVFSKRGQLPRCTDCVPPQEKEEAGSSPDTDVNLYETPVTPSTRGNNHKRLSLNPKQFKHGSDFNTHSDLFICKRRVYAVVAGPSHEDAATFIYENVHETEVK